MGAGLEGLGDEREKGAGRAVRWAEERNEFISDISDIGVKGRGEQQQLSQAGGIVTAGKNTQPSRLVSKASRMSSNAAAQNSAMDVDEDTMPSAPEWRGDASPSRKVVVYTVEDNSPGRMHGRDSSGCGKSPTLPRIRSAPSNVLVQEQEHTEGRHSRSSSRHPKSPRKLKSNASAPPELIPQTRLRSTTLRSRGQSPRRTRVEEDELQDVLAEIIHDQSLTLARAARRQKKQGTKDGPEPVTEPVSGRVSPGRVLGSALRPPALTGDPEEESPAKAVRRTKTRRQKRKADAVHDSLPDDAVMEDRVPGLHPLQGMEDRVPGFHPQQGVEDRVQEFHPLQGMRDRVPRFHPLQDLQKFVSKASSRKESSSTSTTWMDLLADVIMWRDVPRSTLMFGAGCFCILSASFIQDFRCGSLTFTAYVALVYLAVVFFHRNFLRGGITAHESRSWELGEAEALEMLKVILPAVNLVLKRCGQLFSGDPSTTLKVASVLWLLAQAGYIMTIWSLLRFGFVWMFIIPKLYCCYSFQLHVQAEAYADRLRNAWSAYVHKKAAICVSLVVAWNLSSATSRLYGAFLLLVAIKIYTHHLANQVNDQMETDQTLPVSEQPEERLLTPPPAPYLPLQGRPSFKKGPYGSMMTSLLGFGEGQRPKASLEYGKWYIIPFEESNLTFGQIY